MRLKRKPGQNDRAQPCSLQRNIIRNGQKTMAWSARNWAATHYFKVKSFGLNGFSQAEHGNRADRRGGALAPFQRQADERELPLPQQRLEIAQAFDMGD